MTPPKPLPTETKSGPGRNPNPMNSRCGLEGCDCEYTIGLLNGALNRLQQRFDEVWAERCGDSDHDSSCPCYQAGYDAEDRQPQERD